MHSTKQHSALPQNATADTKLQFSAPQIIPPPSPLPHNFSHPSCRHRSEPSVHNHAMQPSQLQPETNALPTACNKLLSYLMNSSFSALQMGKELRLIILRYSSMKKRHPSLFWMPPVSTPALRKINPRAIAVTRVAMKLTRMRKGWRYSLRMRRVDRTLSWSR